MANTLMFEVGIKSAQEQLDKIKQEFTKANGDLSKLLNIKVSIDDVDAIRKALNQIGDSPKLRALRQEIESLNREFSKLAAGAGGVGEIPIRGAKQEAVGLKAELEAADRKLKQLTEDLDVMRRNRDMAKPEDKGSYTMPMKALKEQIAAQEELVKKRQTAYEQAVENVGKVSNATKNATQQESEAMNHLKQQVVDLTEKVRILQTALSKSSGAPITSPINIDLSAIEPTIKTLNEAVSQLKKSMDLLWEATNRMEGSMKSLGGIEALEKIKTEAVSTKQQVDNLAKSVSGMSKQAEKKGSESTLADNLQRLKSAITDVKAEYSRLNEAYGSAKDMGMPTNNAIEERLYNLRRLITSMEQLAQAAQTAGSAEAEALSKSKAFSFVKFDNNQLFSKETSKLYSRKEIDGYIKSIDEFIKAEGRMTQTSGAATNTIAEIGTALGRAAERASQAGTSFSQTTQGIQNFAMNIETARLAYDKTLRGIADLESRISAGQKANMDKESLDFMNGLKQRAQQWADVLKKILGEDMKGNPAYREFLSMSSNILTRPQMGNGLQALLGADWKILMKNIGDTFNMLMKFSGFNKSLTLDNTTLANWLKGEEAVRRLDNALKDLNKQWAATNNEAKTPDLTAKYEAQKRAIESLVAQIKGAMTEQERMANRNGLSDLLGVGFKNAVGYDNTRLIQDMKSASKDAAKAEAEYMKEVDKFTEQSKKAYTQAEKEKEKAAQERAKAVAAAEKTVQAEITKTESLQKKVEQSITRGEAAKRDMSGLYAQNAALEQQVRLMEGLKNSISRGTIDPNSDIISKRIKDIQSLREDTELLRKAEEKLTTAREQANRRNDNQQLKNLKDEEKSVNDAWIQYNRLGIKINELIELRNRGLNAKMDVSSIEAYINRAMDLRSILKEIFSNGGRTIDSPALNKLGLGQGMLTSQFLSHRAVKIDDMWDDKGLKKFKEDLSQTERESAKADANIRKLGMAFNELKNYMKANGGSEEMRKLQAEIQVAIQKMRQLMNAGNFAGAVNVYERMAGSLRQAATATKEFENSQHSLSSTISHTNGNLQGQSQILSDLKSMATQYLSVWGAQSFINNIIELGGQLEQQRLSIGAILQDTAQANHLFSQIKDLAIKSPFGVQQLDAMSKQLSAYGFQYSELYEWTKRLADISAATGTSVDRLALALGHVRSEGALSGYTLRQFSMGNIPLLQKLSENLGKTKQEIRKMTRNKEIGYEDVLNVLKQLTDEGGMFFEAQETMSQALNAKFKNLRDSFQIMYSEMAEGAPGDFLKGLATTLTDLSRQWQILMPMVGAAGAMWAMNKASAALVNVELAKMATLTNANTLASSKYSVAQLRQIANWEKMPHAMVRARLALQGFKTSLLSLGKMVFSWPTAIFAAIEALTYMWAKQSRESEKAKEMTEVLTNTALESQKNLAKQLSNIDPYEEGMSDSVMKTGIESMTESIKNYGVNAQAVLETVFGKDAEGRVMSLAEKYQYLREELEKTEKVYKEMQRTSGGIEFGVEFTDGGWLDDDIQTDLTNYSEAVKEYEDAFVTMTANYATAVNNALEQVKKASPEFKRIADGLSSDAERVKWLYENQGEYGGIYNMFKGALHREDPNAGGGVLGTQLGDNLRSAKQEAMKELDQFLKGTEEWFKKFGYDFTENGKNLSEVQVGNLLRQSKEWLEKHPEWQNIYDVIWDKLNKRWGLPIVPDVTEIEEELPQWLVDFQNELDKTGIKLTAKMSMEEIVDEMKKAYDKAQTTINKLGPIAMQAKIDIKGLTDEYIENYKFLNPELYETLKELKKAQDSQSQVTTAANKRGLQLKGMKKDGTHKAEKQNQEAAKAVREQVRVIKEAADAFQYWREKVGDKGALEHVQQEFGDVLAKIGITATNIEDVRGQLKKIPQMKEYKAITDKKVKTEIDKEIAKDNDQFIRKDFERNTEKFLSQTKIQLDSLTRAWDTFNKVREATGNVELAIQLSGVTYNEGIQNLADALKDKIQRDLDGISAGLTIDLNVNLSDEDIQRKVEETFDSMKPVQGEGELNEAYANRLAEYQSRIKGIVEEYQKWRDLQRDVEQRDIDTFGKLVGSAVDLQSQLQRINDEYRKTLESLNRLKNEGKISEDQYNQSSGIATANYQMEIVKAKESYQFLMDGVITMNKNAAKRIKRDYVDALDKQLKTGAITAKQYADSITEINDKMRDFENAPSGFQSYLQGGLNGVAENMMTKGKSLIEQGAQSIQKGDVKAGQAMKNMGANMQQAGGEMMNAVAITDMIIHGIDGFVQGLNDTYNEIKDLFEAAGRDVNTDAWEDWGTFFSTFSAASASATKGWDSLKNGDIGGVISGVVGSFTNWYTGFAQGHDRKDDNLIKSIDANIRALEMNTEAIKDSRERTLGYDYGVINRRLSEYYSPGNKLNAGLYDPDAIADLKTDIQGLALLALPNAMTEYYGNKSDLTGYKQELENLKKERDDIAIQWAAEKDKKKESQEALDEYVKKIAELDEQILYFSEDLAKELWGIDMKSWASQISDALWTAFENGEDAVKAFGDVTDDIIADVAKKMMNIHLIEPVMKDLEAQLFGGVDSNGNRFEGKAYNSETGEWNEKETLQILGKFFGEDGEFAKVVNSAEDFYRMAEQTSGREFGSDSSSSSMSNTIKGITEQTADLLASYVNACRLDLSVVRELHSKAVFEYWPSQIRLMTSSNDSLVNIEQHTAAIMRSNDTIADKITSLDASITGLKNKTWKLPIG